MATISTDRNQEEELTSKRAKLLALPYLDTRTIGQIETTNSLLNRNEMEQMLIVPITQNQYQVNLGITERTSKTTIDQLKQRFPDKNLAFNLISDTGLRTIVNAFKSLEVNEKNTQIATLSIQEKINHATQQDLLSVIAQEAYYQNASDIHIEPAKNKVLIRIRIDGVLHPLATLSLDQYKIFLSIIQTRAGIKWGADYPQTGRLTENLSGVSSQKYTVDMRVETVPTLRGTDVVLRIFKLEVAYLDLKNTGFNDTQINRITDLISHPHGMVLVVGPTGSGKTSTQYSIINFLNKPEVKIVTLEDPIEYELDGVAQIPVKTADSESFMVKFRAVLREDPDIIMLGEIRDADTAKTALQAALTGHLVLSTFHAASSAAALSRMSDMIGTNPLLASSVRLIIAQRLLRKLCENCKERHTPTAQEISDIQKHLENISKDTMPNLHSIQIYRAVGCTGCGGIGYKGRILVSEHLQMSPPLEKLLTESSYGLTTQKIQEAAIANGMITLLQDAIFKVIAGITSLDEVYRTIE